MSQRLENQLCRPSGHRRSLVTTHPPERAPLWLSRLDRITNHLSPPIRHLFRGSFCQALPQTSYEVPDLKVTHRLILSNSHSLLSTSATVPATSRPSCQRLPLLPRVPLAGALIHTQMHFFRPLPPGLASSGEKDSNSEYFPQRKNPHQDRFERQITSLSNANPKVFFNFGGAPFK